MNNKKSLYSFLAGLLLLCSFGVQAADERELDLAAAQEPEKLTRESLASDPTVLRLSALAHQVLLSKRLKKQVEEISDFRISQFKKVSNCIERQIEEEEKAKKKKIEVASVYLPSVIAEIVEQYSEEGGYWLNETWFFSANPNLFRYDCSVELKREATTASLFNSICTSAHLQICTSISAVLFFSKSPRQI